jgi:hypothetical protein
MILTNCSGEYYVWRNGQVCIRLVCVRQENKGELRERVYIAMG